jgi:hypothetical protein
MYIEKAAELSCFDGLWIEGQDYPILETIQQFELCVIPYKRSKTLVNRPISDFSSIFLTLQLDCLPTLSRVIAAEKIA